MTKILHEVLAAERREVILRWIARLGAIAPENTPSVELVDHMPAFVDEVVTALRNAAGHTALVADQTTETAEVHGIQRLRLGFSLDAVVREYGHLRDAILDVGRDFGAEIHLADLQVIFDLTIDGIARAVSEYSRQRDAELMRQANEHFAFVAHELRNPLSSALNALEVLKRKNEISSESRSTQTLERGLQNLHELIDQTLRSARIASGLELRREPVTLAGVFEEVVSAARPEAEIKGIELRAVFQNDRAIPLDRRLVRSTLHNLVRNAVRYSAEGGKVELRGSISEERATIEVSDSCGGLPPGRVEAAFAPFVRLDSKQDGFGLGLAIAKQAAEAHGGNIRVQNVPGTGCIFVLELPLV